MSNELMQTIARVRRAMPRNPDVMVVCDALERSIISKTPTPSTGGAHKTMDGKFDRTGYQRELMRKRRAAKKTK